jgi:hypothetical protein
MLGSGEEAELFEVVVVVDREADAKVDGAMICAWDVCWPAAVGLRKRFIWVWAGGADEAARSMMRRRSN